MLPLVSIIIPVYNVASYVEDCMKSICQQTYENFEVILVDDCGTDSSISLALEVCRNNELDPIVLRHEHNRGLSAARNTGMTVANGEYVLFVDSDDQLTPECIVLLVRQAEKVHADMVFGNYETFGEKVVVHHQSSKPYVMAWNKLCRRSFLQGNGISFCEGLIHEDCPWSFEIECKAKVISWISEVTYRYLIRQGGLQTAGLFEKHFESYCIILKLYAKVIGECQDDSRLLVDQMTERFEIQKALYFAASMNQVSSHQLKEMYHLIRSLRPIPRFSKADSHYWLPEPLGFILYRKFHRYHFC